MFALSPIFSPFRNTSANVSMPSNTSSALEPSAGTALASNVREYSH